jgi:predicted dehydrogenase
MDRDISILLAGIGGYGEVYAKELLEYSGDRKFHIAGVVEPFPQNSPYYEKFKKLDIPVFSTIEEYYKERAADLAVISSPIQFHREQACYALSKGSNVLCEKPISATVEDGIEMIKARDLSKKFLSIGYQWSYSEAIQKLKRDVMSGIYGKPLRFKTLLLWPRKHRYFKRAWAGKIKDSEGRMVYDSIANNATAHYIHNMFYILGETTDTGAIPAEATAELYRANDIENYDTAAFRVITDKGVELLYIGTHAVEKIYGPVFTYEFEKGSIVYRDNAGDNTLLTGIFKDGTKKTYGEPNDNVLNKLWNIMDAINNRAKILCGPEAAMPHAMCIAGISKAVPDIAVFDKNISKCDGKGDESITYVKGLYEDMKVCYDNWKLPSEMGMPWSRPAKSIKIPPQKL